ncbi:MAG TPA: protein-glutamate O-methyltransferase CheR [Chryseolinea sp.]|nr:protein-glutamate O-methyltransferase CheR [Chryseolinea sp.]
MTASPFTSKKISTEQFAFLSNYLSSKYGLNIPNEKKVLLESRLISRLNHLKLESIEAYLDHIFKSKDGKQEYEVFVEHITNHKTFFFRENYQFEFLKRILPDYQKSHGNRLINIWSAGCSTGEEVYTLGIIMNEKRQDIPMLDYKITGTDISIPSLKRAARGMFSMSELENMPEGVQTKYFSTHNHNGEPILQFSNAEIKSKINLGVLNLNNKQYNFSTAFDFIFCRNVTIYFNAKTRNEVLTRIVDKLKPGGYLFLGHSETALGTNLPLKSIQPTIYQKVTV